jgi:hypothetical protein
MVVVKWYLEPLNVFGGGAMNQPTRRKRTMKWTRVKHA